jgi:hypothetical protein
VAAWRPEISQFDLNQQYRPVPKPSFCKIGTGEMLMPTDTVIVVTGVVAAFIVFAVALAWAASRTNRG